MKPTSTTVLISAVALAVGALAIATFPSSGTAAPSGLAPESQLERGRYLVNQVGLCVDCHSPMTEKGEFIEGQHLTGAPIAFFPKVPMPWAGAAPRIAGLPEGYTPEDMVQFLITGARPNGRPSVLPPMPPYRMNRGDAEAVVAYLRSLPKAAP